MTWFLDTNVCVFLLRGNRPALTEKFSSRSPSDFRVPSMVAAELVYGARKSEQARRNLEAVSRFLRPLTVMPFDAAAAQCYGEIRAILEQKGKLIGPNDLVIAATVLANHGVLLTNNTREFQRVPSLRVEDWTVKR